MTKETAEHNRNNGHPNAMTVGMVLLLIVGALILVTTLALNFFMHFLSIPALVLGIVLIGVSVGVLAFKSE